jgi:hypothetical protein
MKRALDDPIQGVLPTPPFFRKYSSELPKESKAKAWLPPSGKTGTALGAVHCAFLASFPIP